MTASPPLVTGLLQKWRDGDESALGQLLPLVHDTLHRLAHRYVNRERRGHTLQTTALVNEAFLRLVGQQDVDWESRAHFFAVSAQVMRHILVDYARQRASGKRGGEYRHVTLDGDADVSAERSAELVALDDALSRSRESQSPRQQDRRAALLRWHEQQGSRRDPPDLRDHRGKGLAAGQGVAVPRTAGTVTRR